MDSDIILSNIGSSLVEQLSRIVSDSGERVSFKKVSGSRSFTYPDEWTVNDLLRHVEAYVKQQTKVISYNWFIGCPIPAEGAVIVTRVIKEVFGHNLQQIDTETFFGTIRPKVIKVPVSSSKSEEIFLGKMKLADFTRDESMTIQLEGGEEPGVTIVCNVQRQRADKFEKIVELAKAELSKTTIYAGQVLRFNNLDWMWDNGRYSIPEDLPIFMPIQPVNPNQLHLNPPERDTFGAEVMARIVNPDYFVKSGMGRGCRVILDGTFGTGKSLSINLAISSAIKQGWTTIYISRASCFTEAARLASNLSRIDNVKGVLLIVEDIETVTSSGDRTEETNELSNVLDGAGKDFEDVILLMTTNDVNSIHPLFLRRAVVVEYERPISDVREQIIRYYAGKSIKGKEDISTVVEFTDGYTPVILEKIVYRAMAFAMSKNGGKVEGNVTAKMLLNSAKSFSRQHQLIYDPVTSPESPPFENVVSDAVSKKVEKVITEATHDIAAEVANLI